MAVAECAPRDLLSLFVRFVRQYVNISTDTELREGLSAIAELLVEICEQTDRPMLTTIRRIPTWGEKNSLT